MSLHWQMSRQTYSFCITSVVSAGFVALLLTGRAMAQTPTVGLPGHPNYQPPMSAADAGPLQPVGGTAADIDDGGEPLPSSVPSLLPMPPSLWRPARLLRGINGSLTFLPDSGGRNGFDQTDLSLGASLPIPLPGDALPLIISPGFRMMSLGGPESLDLPNDLYSMSASVTYIHNAGDDLNIAFGVAPGFSSDFGNTSADAFRMTGFAIGTLQYNPELQLQFGLAYLNRSDLPIMPALGAVWTPDDRNRLELTLPRPRYARRVRVRGSGEDQIADWLYAAGELGGGTWAVERADGRNDLLTLRDFRFVVGYERKATVGPDTRWEAGYVFGRKAEYDWGGESIRPSDTLMLRASISF